MNMENSSFTMPVSVRWSDIDVNGHLRHSVYYDYGAQARIKILHDQGISMRYMQEQQIGPVLFREECRFKKEIRFGDLLKIETSLSALRKDGSRFSVAHKIIRADQICALIQLDGAWMDTSKRKLCPPTDEIREAFKDWPKSEDFNWI
jgi:acyl-CoA thioester hydrolase